MKKNSLIINPADWESYRRQFEPESAGFSLLGMPVMVSKHVPAGNIFLVPHEEARLAPLPRVDIDIEAGPRDFTYRYRTMAPLVTEPGYALYPFYTDLRIRAVDEWVPQLSGWIVALVLLFLLLFLVMLLI